jgi:hypothetical protein
MRRRFNWRRSASCAQDWQVFECVLFLEMKHGLQFPGLPMMSAPIPADAAVVYEGRS